MTKPGACRWVVGGMLGLGLIMVGQGAEAPNADPFRLQAELQTEGAVAQRRPPPATRHIRDLSPEQVQARAAQARNRSEFIREKVEGRWFAALVNRDGPAPMSIAARFASWQELADFVATNKALVEVWADAGGGASQPARRLTAAELAARQSAPGSTPSLVTITVRDPAAGQARTSAIAFGYDAPARALAELQSAAAARKTAPDRGADQLLQPLIGVLGLEGSGALALGGAGPQSGGVVEQILPARPGGVPPPPQFQAGAEAFQERHAEVLADLIEWRQHLQKRSLGAPQPTNELLQTATALEDLASKGIWIDDADALLSVDAFNNRFVYRRYVEGQPQLVEVTGAPSEDERRRRAAALEARRQTEARERAALGPSGRGIALVHRAQDANGRPELGPLMLIDDTAEGLDSLLALLDRLPVTERARLRFDGLSHALVDADFEGNGRKDRFFLTIEYPPGKVVQRERINPLTGEPEVLRERDGLLLSAATDRRMIEFDYNADREEVASRAYANTGSRHAPVKGSLIEETRTVETWQRDLSQADVDPYQPAISRSRVNHVTGETTRDVYGLFPLPVATIDEQFITSRQFNPFGVLMSETVFENGLTDQEQARPLLARLNEPIVGIERFRTASTLPPNELDRLRNLKAQKYLATFSRQDLVRGGTRIQSFDNAHWGRKARESFLERLEGTNALPVDVTYEYQDTSWFGLIPTRITQRVTNGALISQQDSQSYDPFLKELVAAQTDWTGKTVLNTWPRGAARPRESRSAGRRTVWTPNRRNTEYTCVTTTADTGEELSRWRGRFDTNQQLWQIEGVIWFRPGITNEIQRMTLSSADRVLNVLSGDSSEERVSYGATGWPQAIETFRRQHGSAQRLTLQERLDDFRWKGGEQDARVQRYVSGRVYDTFRRTTDVEGRTIVDGLRTAGDLTLKTTIEYDGWSNRPRSARALQNDQVRWTRDWLQGQRESDGRFLVPVKTTPAWGLARVETVRADQALGRPMACRWENGDTDHVLEWVEGTDLPKITEHRDRTGKVLERHTRHVSAGTDETLPYDLIERRRLTWWGETACIETNAVLAGTDRVLFTLTSVGKIYSDHSVPFDAPGFLIDSAGKAGVQLQVRGRARGHVLRLFRSRIENAAGPGAKSSRAEPLLAVDTIDLSRGTPSQVLRQVWDRAGSLLDEHWLALPAAESSLASDDALMALAARATPMERLHYRYHPGWLSEPAQTNNGPRMLVFSRTRPSAGVKVNEDGRRDFATAIEGIRTAPVSIRSASGLNSYFFRRLQNPVLHERHPRTNVPGLWVSWSATELTPEGQVSSQTNVVSQAGTHGGALGCSGLGPVHSAAGQP